MGLFDDVPSVQPSVTEQVVKLVNNSRGLYQIINGRLGFLFNSFWRDPFYSPSEICEALGNKAVAFFQISAALQDILTLADPNYQRLVPPEGYTVEPQADGRVIITKVEP